MPPIETCRSAITSSSADCTLAGARLISSASTKLANTGPSSTSNSSLALPVDPGADDVGGHQVGGELDAGERAADDLGERLDGQRLGHAGHALEQAVAPGEQADEHPLDQPVLADDDPLDLEERALQGVHLTLQTAVGRRALLRAGSKALRRALAGETSGALRRPTR